ncbi:Domain of unknown function (DUF4239)-containing protein [uncultured virus]|nr:Domain of unknown function (DUF4239)-containing protein [uncultured virus]
MAIDAKRRRRHRRPKKVPRHQSWTNAGSDEKDILDNPTIKSTQRTTGSCKPNTFLYDLPSSTLLVLFIVVAVILSLVGLTAYKYFVPTGYFTFDSNSLTAIFIGIIGVPVGVVLAFVITGVWQSYNDADAKNEREASNLLFLYRSVQQLPDTGKILRSIRNYISYIIEVEFPQMRAGIDPVEGLELLLNIGSQIYNLNPVTPKEIVLYEESIDIYNEVLALRAARIGFQEGLAPELWWVLIIGVVIIIIMSWFVYSRRVVLHYIMTAAIAAGLASLLFLIVVLDRPYQGQFSLDENSFIGARILIDGGTTVAGRKRRCA